MSHLQPYYRGDERGDEEQAGKRRRLLEEENADKNGANGPYAGPHRVGRAYRDGLQRLGEQGQTYDHGHKESHKPETELHAAELRHLGHAEGESRLGQSGYNQKNPIHNYFILLEKRGKDKLSAQNTALHLIKNNTAADRRLTPE